MLRAVLLLLRCDIAIVACCVIAFVATESPCAESGEYAKQNAQLAQNLEDLVEFLSNKPIDRVAPRIDVRGVTSSHRKESELHLRFLIGAASIADNNKDGLAALPVQVSGFSSEIQTQTGQPDQTARRQGTDLQVVKIEVVDLFMENSDSKGTPKAKIDVPKMNQGTDYDAQRLARDLIQFAFEWYLPEVEIEGEKRFEEKLVSFENNTDEAVLIWVHYFTRLRQQTSFRWSWQPTQPGGPDREPFRIPPGKSLQLTEIRDGKEAPIRAQAISFWAKSESGDTWEQNRYQPISLVESDPQLGGDLAYHAVNIQEHVHHIQPIPGPRVFTERLVRFRNETPDELKVSVRFLVSDHGTSAWRDFSFPLKSGQDLSPLLDGFRIRSSQLLLSAQSSNQKFTKHDMKPMWLVEDANGLRAYKAQQVGTYLYTFKPPGAPLSDSQVHGISGLPVFDGKREIARIESTVPYRVLRKQSSHYLIEFLDGSTRRQGWVREQDGFTLKLIPVFDGTRVVGQLDPLQDYQVVRRAGTHTMVELINAGQPVRGWVRQADGFLAKPDEKQ